MSKRRKSIPQNRWPGIDRVVWHRVFSSDDPFDKQNPTARWSQRTKVTLAESYGRWLGFLETHGLLNDAPPELRVTPEAVSRYVNAIKSGLRATTVYRYIYDLQVLMELMAPNQDWEWLSPSKILRRNKLIRRRQERDLISAVRLYALGFELMKEADAAFEMRPIDRAILFRDGLMIALLAARPLRRSNFMKLRLGTHLKKDQDAWVLHLPARETKNRRPINSSLPWELGIALDHFLLMYRPTFRAAGTYDRLWPSLLSRPLDRGGVYEAIRRRTKQAFGFALNPHLFRTCAATTIATFDPANVSTATHVLGHAHLRSTEQYYIKAQTIEASRRYQRHLDTLRERLGRDT